MTTYKASNFTFDECIRILNAYTQVIRSTTCPDVRKEYVQAKDSLIAYMKRKWRLT